MREAVRHPPGAVGAVRNALDGGAGRRCRPVPRDVNRVFALLGPSHRRCAVPGSLQSNGSPGREVRCGPVGMSAGVTMDSDAADVDRHAKCDERRKLHFSRRQIGGTIRRRRPGSEVTAR